MDKEVIVLVVSGLHERQLLEVSLRKKGYAVHAFGQILEAGKFIQQNHTDLLILDPRLTDVEIKSFVSHLRGTPKTQDLPIVAIISDSEVETKVDFLKIGVEDFVTRPLLTREVIIKVTSVLERAKIKARISYSSGFEGDLSEHPALDTFKRVQEQNLTGRVVFTSKDQEAQVYFKDGNFIHAMSTNKVAGRSQSSQGERVIFNVMTWDEGRYNVNVGESNPVQQTIHSNTETLLYEGVQRLGRWQQILQALPELQSTIEVDGSKLSMQIAELSDKDNDILRLIDGQTSIENTISKFEGDELRSLQVLFDLFNRKIVRIKDEEKKAKSSNLSASIHEALKQHSTFPGPGPADTALALDSLQKTLESNPKGVLDSITAERVISGIPAIKPVSVEQAPQKREPVQTPPYNYQTHTLPPAKIEPSASNEVPAHSEPPSSLHPDSTKATQDTELETTQHTSNAPDAKEENTTEQTVVDQDQRTDASTRFQKQVEPLKQDTSTNQSAPPEPLQKEVANQKHASPPVEQKVDAVHSEENASSVEPQNNTQESQGDVQSGKGNSTRQEDSISDQWMKHEHHDNAHDVWGDLEADEVELPTGAKRAKKITLIMGGVSILLIGGYFAYNKLFLPQPVKLGVHDTTPGKLPELKEQEASQEKQPLPSEKTDSPEPNQASDEENIQNQKPSAKALNANAAANEEIKDEPNPTEPAEDAEADLEKYNQLLTEAKTLEKKRKRKNAEKKYREAIELNPSGSEALANLSFLLLNRGKNKEALKFAEKATSFDPTNSKAWITLGAARQALRDRKGAQEAYKQCVKLGVGSFVSDCRLML